MSKKTRTLHVGVDVTRLLDVQRHAKQYADVRWHVDGDGWEVWGEAVGTDENDGATLHLSSRKKLTDEDARTLVAMLNDIRALIPMRRNVEPGQVVYGVLTNQQDWSEDVSTIAVHTNLRVTPEKHW